MWRRLGKSILKYWYSLIPDAIALTDYVFSRLGETTTMMPTWLFWTFAIGGMLAASVLAYRDLYLEYAKTKQEVIKSEWEYKREGLRKQREKLRELPRLLNEMREQTMKLVFSQAHSDIPENKRKELTDVIPYAQAESNKIVVQSAADGKLIDKQQMFLAELSNAMEEIGYGITRLRKNSKDWNVLEAKIYNLKPEYEIEAELVMHIKDFNIVLDGFANWELYDIYTGYDSHTELLGEQFAKKAKRKHIGGKTGRDYLLTLAYSKVTKRVNELLSGDEAK